MRYRAKSIGLVGLAIALCGCGQALPPMAGAKWAAALRDPNARVRRKAAFTLGNIGPSHAAVLPALVAALEDADGGVRCQAILGLVKYGPAGRLAIPSLGRLQQKDPEIKVRQYAARAIEQLSQTQ
jgi:HEAT repeat protein